jgi:hypothetical protein
MALPFLGIQFFNVKDRSFFSAYTVDHLEHVEDVWDPRTGVVSKSTLN